MENSASANVLSLADSCAKRKETMPYKTRPYLKHTLGIIPSPFKYYLVDENRMLHVKPLVGEPEDFPLTKAPIISPEQGKGLKGFFNRLIGIGNITIGTKSGSITCERIRNIKSFKSALEGEHWQVQKDSKHNIIYRAEKYNETGF